MLCEEVFMLTVGKQGLFLFRARKKGTSDVEPTKDAMKM